jgi:hypothetical protein
VGLGVSRGCIVLPHTREDHNPGHTVHAFRMKAASSVHFSYHDWVIAARAPPVTKSTCYKRMIIGISHVFFFQSVMSAQFGVHTSSSISIARRGHILGLRVPRPLFFNKNIYLPFGIIQGNHVSNYLGSRNIPDAHLTDPPFLLFPDLSGVVMLMTSTTGPSSIASASPTQSPIARQSPDVDRMPNECAARG